MSEQTSVHPLTFEEYDALPEGTELWVAEHDGYRGFSLSLVKKKEEKGRANPNTIPRYEFADPKRGSTWYAKKYDEKAKRVRLVSFDEYCVDNPLFNASPLEIVSWWLNTRR